MPSLQDLPCQKHHWKRAKSTAPEAGSGQESGNRSQKSQKITKAFPALQGPCQQVRRLAG
jgi:hypothetical protein